MGKFKFRLQTLLRLRETVRDERRSQLAQAYQAEEILRQQQEMVAGEIGQVLEASRKALGPGALDVDRLLGARRYELTLRAQQEQLQRQQAAIAAEVERRREALVEANRDVRVMELLREKQLARHRDEEEQRERKVLDEVAQRRRVREAEP